MLTKDDCYCDSHKYCACVEFYPSELQRHGFHTSQLIEYSLEPNPEAKDDPNAPPLKFALAFSTADVVILGWRLGMIVDRLRENELASVRVLPQRFAQLEGNKPFVASIIITPVSKGGDAPAVWKGYEHRKAGFSSTFSPD